MPSGRSFHGCLFVFKAANYLIGAAWIQACGKTHGAPPAEFEVECEDGKSSKAKQRQELRKIRVAHQVTIAFAGSPAPFIECPHDQTLTAPTISCGENSLKVSMVFFEFSLDV